MYSLSKVVLTGTFIAFWDSFGVRVKDKSRSSLPLPGAETYPINCRLALPIPFPWESVASGDNAGEIRQVT